MRLKIQNIIIGVLIFGGVFSLIGTVIYINLRELKRLSHYYKVVIDEHTYYYTKEVKKVENGIEFNSNGKQMSVHGTYTLINPLIEDTIRLK